MKQENEIICYDVKAKYQASLHRFRTFHLIYVYLTFPSSSFFGFDI